MNGVLCDYCKKQSELVCGDIIYPHRKDLHFKKFYYCAPCGAYVGCHPDTVQPLGRLANSELRRWKRLVHAELDPIWINKKMTRSKAYKMLSEKLNISKRECHIGMFNIDMCREALTAVQCIKEECYR